MQPPLLSSAVLILALAAGCATGPDASPSGRTFTDDLGNEVVLRGEVTRIVTLAPSLTELVFAAGGGERLVGAGLSDDHPPQIDSVRRFSAHPVDFEAVAAMQPDLVLATDQVNSPRDHATFAALDIPAAFLSFQSLDDVLRGLRTVGRLLGTEDEAEAAADSLAGRLSALSDRISEAKARPRVLFLVGDDDLFSFGRESYMHELIALAGGESMTSDIAIDAPVLSEEYVLAGRPEVIIGPWGEDYDADRLLALHPTWHAVPAVRDKKVYGVEPSIVLRPGPRLVEGVYRLAALLHPSLFDGPL